MTSALPKVRQRRCALSPQEVSPKRWREREQSLGRLQTTRNTSLRDVECQLDEINTTDHVWTIAATRMKANREHRVPLCGRALEILKAALTLGSGRGPLVFPTPRGKPLDAQRLVHLLQTHQIAAVPHGFRSSFRDWAAEKTNHPREVIEAALAHVVQNKVEAAYARSDLFESRHHLMDDWAAYLDNEHRSDNPPRP